MTVGKTALKHFMKMFQNFRIFVKKAIHLTALTMTGIMNLIMFVGRQQNNKQITEEQRHLNGCLFLLEVVQKNEREMENKD